MPEAILFAAIICALVLGLPCFVLSETTGSDAVADFTGSAFSLLLKGAGSISLIGLSPFLSATYLSTCFVIFSPLAFSAAALIFLRFARSAPPASAAPAASLPAGPNFDNTFAYLSFDKPQFGVSIGQAAVFYNIKERSHVLGGGWITEAPNKLAETNL